MYLCNGISNSVNALTSKGEDAALWHHRLRHMSEKGMKILHLKKCTFIRYGVNDFGYHLYDYENHKIIRSRDVIFNEKVLYKNQLQEKKQEKENKENTVLDEITEKVKVPENNNNQQPQQKNHHNSNRHLKHLKVVLED